MCFVVQQPLYFRDLFPGPEYAKEWERERRLEAALQRRQDEVERSKFFWAWIKQQTKDMTACRLV